MTPSYTVGEARKDGLPALGEAGASHCQTGSTLATSVGVMAVAPTLYESCLTPLRYAGQLLVDVVARTEPVGAAATVSTVIRQTTADVAREPAIPGIFGYRCSIRPNRSRNH